MTEPQSWVRVAASNLAGSSAALAEALKGLALTWTPRLLVVLAAPHHNLEAVARELALQLPQTQVIGCTTAGEIAGSRALSDALVLWALGGTGVRVQTGHGLGTGPELREAAQRAASCLETLERRAHTAMILLSDGLGGDQMEVVRGAYDATGIDVPLIGGCAGDGLAMRQTRQLHGQEVFSGAVVAAAISSDRPLGVGVSHGWTPSSEPMLVTESRGTLLSSLDDRPALEVYLDFFNPPASVRQDTHAFADFAAVHPIGIRRRDRIEMRHITGCDRENGALLLVAEVPQGALAFLSRGDYASMLAAAGESATAAVQALGDAPPVGLLLFDCVSRRSIFGEQHLQEEAELIARCAGQVPTAGFYTYGEIARTRGAGGFHNQTLVTLAIA